VTDKIEVTRDFLSEILQQMEGDWLQIDHEFGPTKGGLDADIAIGNAEAIRKLRELLAAPGEPPACVVLPDEQFDRVTELLEANPLATNLSAQRLLRSKRPWSGS
jgi:hypothetical protein